MAAFEQPTASWKAKKVPEPPSPTDQFGEPVPSASASASTGKKKGAGTAGSNTAKVSTPLVRTPIKDYDDSLSLGPYQDR